MSEEITKVPDWVATYTPPSWFDETDKWYSRLYWRVNRFITNDLRYFHKDIKRFFQKQIKGYNDYDLWDVQTAYVKRMLPILKEYRDQSILDRWDLDDFHPGLKDDLDFVILWWENYLRIDVCSETVLSDGKTWIPFPFVELKTEQRNNGKMYMMNQSEEETRRIREYIAINQAAYKKIEEAHHKFASIVQYLHD